MNAKISVFFICVEAIIYLLLCNLHDCTLHIFKISEILIFALLLFFKTQNQKVSPSYLLYL